MVTPANIVIEEVSISGNTNEDVFHILQPQSEIEEFEFYIKFAKPLILSLPDTNERIKAAAWIRKLKTDSGELTLKLNYLKLLLFILQRKTLVGPFANVPDESGPLEALPDDFNIEDVAANFVEVDKKVLKEALERGGSGDWPPYSVACSSDLTEYASSQIIPHFGVQAYFAISRDPLPQWEQIEKAIIPVGENIDLSEPEYTGTISPDISSFVTSDQETEALPPGSSRIPKDKISTKEEFMQLPDDLKNISIFQPKGKDKEALDEYNMEARVAPTWGSNLVHVRDIAGYVGVTKVALDEEEFDVTEEDMLDFFQDDLEDVLDLTVLPPVPSPRPMPAPLSPSLFVRPEDELPPRQTFLTSPRSSPEIMSPPVTPSPRKTARRPMSPDKLYAAMEKAAERRKKEKEMSNLTNEEEEELRLLEQEVFASCQVCPSAIAGPPPSGLDEVLAIMAPPSPRAQPAPGVISPPRPMPSQAPAIIAPPSPRAQLIPGVISPPRPMPSQAPAIIAPPSPRAQPAPGVISPPRPMPSQAPAIIAPPSPRAQPAAPSTAIPSQALAIPSPPAAVSVHDAFTEEEQMLRELEMEIFGDVYKTKVEQRMEELEKELFPERNIETVVQEILDELHEPSTSALQRLGTEVMIRQQEEEGLGGESFIAPEQQDFRWMEDLPEGPGLPEDEAQDSALWESFGWWTEDPDELFEYFPPSPKAQSSPIRDPNMSMYERWADVPQTPPIFSRDPRIREGPAATRIYAPEEFGLGPFEEPVWTSAEQYLKYFASQSPFRDPRDIDRRSVGYLDPQKVFEAIGAAEEEDLFGREDMPALTDISLLEEDFPPPLEDVPDVPEPTLISRDISEEPTPMFMYLQRLPEFTEEEEDEEKDTTSKQLEEDLRIISANIPATTPQRSPSPRRVPAIMQQSPPFVPEIDIEPEPYLPSPERGPERHIVPAQKAIDWDMDIGEAQKFVTPPRSLVLKSESDLQIVASARTRDRAQRLRPLQESPPGIPSPPPMPHLVDAPISHRLPSPMQPEVLPPPGWEWKTPPRFQREPFVPQHRPTPTGISPPRPIPEDLTLFHEKPPEDMLSPEFVPSPVRSPGGTPGAGLFQKMEDIVDMESEMPTEFEGLDVTPPQLIEPELSPSPATKAWKERVKQHERRPFRKKTFVIRPTPGRSYRVTRSRPPSLETIEQMSPRARSPGEEREIQELLEYGESILGPLDTRLYFMDTPPRPPPPGEFSPPTPEADRTEWRRRLKHFQPSMITGHTSRTRTRIRSPDLATIPGTPRYDLMDPDELANQQRREEEEERQRAFRVRKVHAIHDVERDAYELMKARKQYTPKPSTSKEYQYAFDRPLPPRPPRGPLISPPPPSPEPSPPHLLDEPVPEGLTRALVPPSGWSWKTPPRYAPPRKPSPKRATPSPLMLTQGEEISPERGTSDRRLQIHQEEHEEEDYSIEHITGISSRIVFPKLDIVTKEMICPCEEEQLDSMDTETLALQYDMERAAIEEREDIIEREMEEPTEAECLECQTPELMPREADVEISPPYVPSPETQRWRQAIQSHEAVPYRDKPFVVRPKHGRPYRVVKSKKPRLSSFKEEKSPTAKELQIQIEDEIAALEMQIFGEKVTPPKKTPPLSISSFVTPPPSTSRTPLRRIPISPEDSPPTPEIERRILLEEIRLHEVQSPDRTRQYRRFPKESTKKHTILKRKSKKPDLPTILGSPRYDLMSEKQLQEQRRREEIDRRFQEFQYQQNRARLQLKSDIEDINRTRKTFVQGYEDRPAWSLPEYEFMFDLEHQIDIETRPRPKLSPPPPSPEPSPVHPMDEPVPEGLRPALLPPSGWSWQTPPRMARRPRARRGTGLELAIPGDVGSISPPEVAPSLMITYEEPPPIPPSLEDEEFPDLEAPPVSTASNLSLTLYRPMASPRRGIPAYIPALDATPMRDVVLRETLLPSEAEARLDRTPMSLPPEADIQLSPPSPEMLEMAEEVKRHKPLPYIKKAFPICPTPLSIYQLTRRSEGPSLETIPQVSPPARTAEEEAEVRELLEYGESILGPLDTRLYLSDTPPRPPRPGEYSPPTPEEDRREWRRRLRHFQPSMISGYTRRRRTRGRPPSLPTIPGSPRLELMDERQLALYHRQEELERRRREMPLIKKKAYGEVERDVFELREAAKHYELQTRPEEYEYAFDRPLPRRQPQQVALSPAPPSPPPGPSHILDEPLPEDLPQAILPPSGWGYKTPPRLKIPERKRKRIRTPSWVPDVKTPPRGTLFYERPVLVSPDTPSPPSVPIGFSGIDVEGEPEYISPPEIVVDEEEEAEIAALEAEVFREFSPPSPPREALRPRTPSPRPGPSYVPSPESPVTPESQRKAWMQDLELHQMRRYPKRFFTIKPTPSRSLRLTGAAIPELDTIAEQVYSPVSRLIKSPPPDELDEEPEQPSTIEEDEEAEFEALEASLGARPASPPRLPPTTIPSPAPKRRLRPYGVPVPPTGRDLRPFKIPSPVPGPSPSDYSPETPPHQRRLWRQELEMHDMQRYPRQYLYVIKPTPLSTAYLRKSMKRELTMPRVRERYVELSPPSPALRPRPGSPVTITTPTQVARTPEGWSWKTPSPLKQRGIRGETPPELVYSPLSPTDIVLQRTQDNQMAIIPDFPSPPRWSPRHVDVFGAAEAEPLALEESPELVMEERLKSPPQPPQRPATPAAFMAGPRRIPRRGRRGLDPNVLYADTPLSGRKEYEPVMMEAMRFEPSRPLAIRSITPPPTTSRPRYRETPIPSGPRPWKKRRRRVDKTARRRLAPEFDRAESEYDQEMFEQLAEQMGGVPSPTRSPQLGVDQVSPPIPTDFLEDVSMMEELATERGPIPLYTEGMPEYEVRPAFEGQPDYRFFDASMIEPIEEIPPEESGFEWLNCSPRCPWKEQ